jgi:hypothetical protein
VPCIIARIDVWLPLPDVPFLCGPFPFIAKFAQATPKGISGYLPVLLGLNFLADLHADSGFQCHTPPHAGSIVVP